MNLFDQVSSDIKAAMLAKDKVRLETLRGIKKEFLEAKTAKGGNGELADDAATKILVKMVKQRRVLHHPAWRGCHLHRAEPP